MARVSLDVKGGENLAKHLKAIADKLGRGSVVRVGFLEGATYPASSGSEGLSVAQVAFWDEFGTATSPPRPFFRNMIARQSPTWGQKLGKIMKAVQYRTPQAMALLGTDIKDELVKSIVEFDDPPNAPSTIRKKGFDKPLIDKGVMQRAPDFEVENVKPA